MTQFILVTDGSSAASPNYIKQLTVKGTKIASDPLLF